MIPSAYILLVAIALGLSIYAGVSKPAVLWVAVLLLAVAMLITLAR